MDSTDHHQNQNPDLLNFLQLLPGVWMTKSTTCAGPRQWPIHYCCHTSWCGRGRRGGHRDENHKLHQWLADVANFRREQELEKKHKNWNNSKRVADIRRIARDLTAICVDVFFSWCLFMLRVKMGILWIWCVSLYVQAVACIENILSERNGGYHWKCRSFSDLQNSLTWWRMRYKWVKGWTSAHASYCWYR